MRRRLCACLGILPSKVLANEILGFLDVFFLSFVLDASAFQAGIALDHVLVVGVGVAGRSRPSSSSTISRQVRWNERAVVGNHENAPDSH